MGRLFDLSAGGGGERLGRLIDVDLGRHGRQSEKVLAGSDAFHRKARREVLLEGEDLRRDGPAEFSFTPSTCHPKLVGAMSAQVTVSSPNAPLSPWTHSRPADVGVAMVRVPGHPDEGKRADRRSIVTREQKITRIGL